MSALTICFREATIGPADQPIFRHFSWTVEPFQAWVITGSNGSGKSAVAQALAGGLPVASRGASQSAANVLPASETVALISFERQRDVVFDERYHDDSEFVDGGVDPGTAALDFILGRARGAAAVEPPARLRELVQRLGIEPLLGRGLKYLSTGEIRKVLLCRELLREPALLIFDEPYEGLDAATRVVLEDEIERLVAASLLSHRVDTDKPPSSVLVITDRYEHVAPSTTHVLHLEDRRVAFAGTRAAFEARGIPADLKRLGIDETASLTQAIAGTLHDQSRSSDTPEGALVLMRDVHVTYSGRQVLAGLNLSIKPGEHTLVRGPNGCGKTTLLNLINGDNPQVYANDVTVCGFKRGSGESIWDIKARLGQVSYALHVEYAYRCYANLLETVLSGFYDSIGLYREPGYAEVRAAKRWLEVVGLLDKAAEPFTQLSYGEQRVALILRAVIKHPRLLILDEPCHGLDPRHRSEVLTIADYIGQSTDSTLLYVTHDPEEQLTCTRQIFEFTPDHGWTLSSLSPP
ncbi:MAG TPA: ATP-binding cassette domain-containing protein [Polyangiaceae bacterium]|jgi:molybdate transport system ATP-binding protein|nr:ATP-binding cassette domain-containing protein [Polyangiaceae bacterium]